MGLRVWGQISALPLSGRVFKRQPLHWLTGAMRVAGEGVHQAVHAVRRNVSTDHMRTSFLIWASVVEAALLGPVNRKFISFG